MAESAEYVTSRSSLASPFGPQALGEESELANMRFWHALPEGWELMEYKDFLGSRRQYMAEVIRAGFARLAVGQGVAESTVAAAMSAAAISAFRSIGKPAVQRKVAPNGSSEYKQLQQRFWTAFKAFMEENNLTQREMVGRVMVPGLPLRTPPEFQTYAANAPFATCSCTGSLAASEASVRQASHPTIRARAIHAGY